MVCFCRYGDKNPKCISCSVYVYLLRILMAISSEENAESGVTGKRGLRILTLFFLLYSALSRPRSTRSSGTRDTGVTKYHIHKSVQNTDNKEQARRQDKGGQQMATDSGGSKGWPGATATVRTGLLPCIPQWNWLQGSKVTQQLYWQRGIA